MSMRYIGIYTSQDQVWLVAVAMNTSPVMVVLAIQTLLSVTPEYNYV
jgi:hypothetical protein